MPRGNEAGAAAADLRSQYGGYPDVDALIAAQQAKEDPALMAASLRNINPEATAELDLDAVKVPDGHQVLSGAVRGNARVFVVEDPNGRTYKMVEPHNDRYQPPRVTAEQAEARARQQAEAESQMRIAEIRMEVERRVAEARASAEREVTKEMEKIEEQRRKRIEEAASASSSSSEGEPSSAPSGNAGDPSPPSDPAEGSGPKRR